MQEALLPLLRCPVTRTALTLKVIKQAEKVYYDETVTVIEEGVLYAAEDWIYPIIKGVPRLTVEAFLDYESFLNSVQPDYFELKEYLALDSLIESFRIFLRRNKVLSKNLKREYNSFLNFVKKLTSLNSSDKEGLAKLKARIQVASTTAPKKWLLEKIEERE